MVFKDCDQLIIWEICQMCWRSEELRKQFFPFIWTTYNVYYDVVVFVVVLLKACHTLSTCRRRQFTTSCLSLKGARQPQKIARLRSQATELDFLLQLRRQKCRRKFDSGQQKMSRQGLKRTSFILLKLSKYFITTQNFHFWDFLTIFSSLTS